MLLLAVMKSNCLSFPPKQTFASPVLWHIDLFDFFPCGIKDRDAFAGEIDIAFVIDSHAVGAEFANNFFCANEPSASMR